MCIRVHCGSLLDDAADAEGNAKGPFRGQKRQRLSRPRRRTPIQFHISNDREKHSIDAQIVQAATKWKRMALRRFDMQPGEGLCTDMRAVRKDYFLDHDHSVYVDQWDWERAIVAPERISSLP